MNYSNICQRKIKHLQRYFFPLVICAALMACGGGSGSGAANTTNTTTNPTNTNNTSP